MTAWVEQRVIPRYLGYSRVWTRETPYGQQRIEALIPNLDNPMVEWSYYSGTAPTHTPYRSGFLPREVQRAGVTIDDILPRLRRVLSDEVDAADEEARRTRGVLAELDYTEGT